MYYESRKSEDLYLLCAHPTNDRYFPSLKTIQLE